MAGVCAVTTFDLQNHTSLGEIRQANCTATEMSPMPSLRERQINQKAAWAQNESRVWCCTATFNHFQSLSPCRINFSDWDSNIQGSWTQDRTTLSTAFCSAGHFLRAYTTCSCLKVLTRITMTQMRSGCYWQIWEELSRYFRPLTCWQWLRLQMRNGASMLMWKDVLYCFKGHRLSALGSEISKHAHITLNLDE